MWFNILKKVQIPSSATKICSYAFARAKNIERIDLSQTQVRKIDDMAFKDSKFEIIKMPECFERNDEDILAQELISSPTKLMKENGKRVNVEEHKTNEIDIWWIDNQRYNYDMFQLFLDKVRKIFKNILHKVYFQPQTRAGS